MTCDRRDPRTLVPGARARRDAVCRQSAVRSGTHPHRKHEHAGVGPPRPGGGRLPRVEHQRRAGRPGRQRVHLARVAGWACPRSEVDRRRRPGCDAARPKGSAVYGVQLYVADIDVVRRFDRTSGAPLGAWAVPNAGFLNDVAVGADGTVYVTDTGIAITEQGFAPTGHGRHLPVRGQRRGPGDRARRRAGPAQRHRRHPQGLVMVPVGGSTVVGVAPDGELTVLAEPAPGTARRRRGARRRLAGGLEFRRQRRLPRLVVGRGDRDHLRYPGRRYRLRRGPQARPDSAARQQSPAHLPGGSRLRPVPLHRSPHRRPWTYRFGDGFPVLTDARRRTSAVTAPRTC